MNTANANITGNSVPGTDIVAHSTSIARITTPSADIVKSNAECLSFMMFYNVL